MSNTTIEELGTEEQFHAYLRRDKLNGLETWSDCTKIIGLNR